MVSTNGNPVGIYTGGTLLTKTGRVLDRMDYILDKHPDGLGIGSILATDSY